MPCDCTRRHTDDRDELIKRHQEELAHVRDALVRAERQRRAVERERDRLQRRNERLQRQLDAARRAGFRQAAPFAKDRPQGCGRRPGRRAGGAYGRRARPPVPERVAEWYGLREVKEEDYRFLPGDDGEKTRGRVELLG